MAGNLAIFSNGTVVFRGQDGKLHQYYYANGWVHDWLPPGTWNVPSSATDDVASDSPLACNDALGVFYKGTDGYLHRYFFNSALTTPNWQHQRLAANPTSAEAVSGGITSTDASHVFFKGTDNKVHQYYLDGNGWHHDWLTGWNSPASENVAGNLSDKASNHVFYAGTDNKIHQYFFGNTCYQNRGNGKATPTAPANTLSFSAESKNISNVPSLNVFPNPSDDVANILVNGASYDTQIEVTDVLGQVVYSCLIPANKKVEIPLSMKSHNVLFIRLIQQRLTIKAVKLFRL